MNAEQPVRRWSLGLLATGFAAAMVFGLGTAHASPTAGAIKRRNFPVKLVVGRS